jgi:hypothetical protein|tara:strand:- start:1905 stop:2561 length:657 start_codon:yes stop_codon:yes gene_type:complete
MNYFDLFPNVQLPSFSDKRNSSNDYITVKNLFKRGKVRDEFFQNVTTFYQYSVNGDDRPDNVADKVYENDKLDWVVLIANNIINIRDEWPMSQYDFQRYLDNKYDPTQLGQIHHYETTEVRNPDDKLLLQSGLTVDSDFTFSYTYEGIQYSVSNLTSVSNFQHEVNKNDKKRLIYLIRPEYVGTVISDMREILTYTDSSQFINRKLKRGDNLRVLEAR